MNLVEVKTDWYEQLIHDLQTLVFDGVVKTKHAIGKRILEDELKFEKPEYGSHTIETLSVGLNVSSRDLYRCIQFARKYSEIPESVTRDKLPWRTIVNDLLPEHKPVEPDLLDMSRELSDLITIIAEGTHRILPTLTDIEQVIKTRDMLLHLAQDVSILHLECMVKYGELLERSI